MERIALSLAGHTNLGKTTLARTLLRRDVGTVDDRPHVTDLADGHVLAGDAGAEILLWDLPGFGDSIKLRRRLESSGLSAWLAMTFDRWFDRPLWCGQQLLRNVREEADVILYVVDGQADPAASPEVAAELAVLAWVGKPIVLLLNQTGLPDPARDLATARRWRAEFSSIPTVRDAMVLDGWSRCWVQEMRLLQRVALYVADSKRAHYERLLEHWSRQTHVEPFLRSMAVLGRALAATATDQAAIGKQSIGEFALAKLTGKLTRQESAARDQLTERLLKRSQNSMEELFAIHGVEGAARSQVDRTLEGLTARQVTAAPGWWGLFGAMGSGALGGLIADIKAGGLTFGGGTVAGAILGGLGAYALGYGFKKFKNDGQAFIGTTPEFLMAEWTAAAMRYLCVAHLGRGRGRWDEPLPEAWPEAWKAAIDTWTRRHESTVRAALAAGDADNITRLLTSMLEEFFATWYPPDAPEPEQGSATGK